MDELIKNIKIYLANMYLMYLLLFAFMEWQPPCLYEIEVTDKVERPWVHTEAMDPKF